MIESQQISLINTYIIDDLRDFVSSDGPYFHPFVSKKILIHLTPET